MVKVHCLTVAGLLRESRHNTGQPCGSRFGELTYTWFKTFFSPPVFLFSFWGPLFRTNSPLINQVLLSRKQLVSTILVLNSGFIRVQEHYGSSQDVMLERYLQSPPRLQAKLSKVRRNIDLLRDISIAVCGLRETRPHSLLIK